MLRSIVVRTTIAFVCSAAFTGSAAAQIQDSGQQRCLNKSSGSARKVATATIKNSADCLKKAASGTLPMGTTAEDCLIGDLDGKIAKARTKTSGNVTKNCGGANVPDFGFTSDATLNDAHELEAVTFVPDCFGPDLDAALAGPLATDTKAKCTSGALAATGKVADAMLKTWLSCLKNGLKNEVILDDATMQACLADLNSDPRDRISKAVEKVESKLQPGACPATPGDYFPNLDGVDELCDRYGLALPLNASTLTTCLTNRMRCRVCRMINEANGLQQNCDLLDDGSVDGTCPECPNGEIDAGEECDDGNFTDGDGCTSLCILEFCGDGIINDSGTEECDDAELNSDVTPNACREDCTLPVCGDGVTDDGFDEECDAGGVPSADCDPDCTESVCGDGDVNSLDGEVCDDGNFETDDDCIGCQPATCGDGFVHTGFEQCDGTECCTLLCLHALPGTACEGTEDVCTSPQCNGSGTCLESPANEGSSCDDDNECTVASSCQSGICAANEYSGVGLACEWVVVGASTNNTGMRTVDGAIVNSGNWCASHGEFDAASEIAGTIVSTDDDNNNGRGILFAENCVVDGDIIADGFKVSTDPLTPQDLPGLVGVTQVLAGQHVNKNPPGTFYDTVGADSRIDDCEAAQADLAVTKAALNALPSTANLGGAYFDLPTGPAPAINAVNVGGINVFDMTHLTGSAAGTSITINGGGNANTVIVLRISQRLNTAANWTFNLTGGLTANRLLFYVTKNGGGIEACALGLNNVGAGTLFCPDMQVHLNGGVIWSGAFYGGDSGSNGEVRIGDDSVITYAPFTADVD